MFKALKFGVCVTHRLCRKSTGQGNGLVHSLGRIVALPHIAKQLAISFNYHDVHVLDVKVMLWTALCVATPRPQALPWTLSI